MKTVMNYENFAAVPEDSSLRIDNIRQIDVLRQQFDSMMDRLHPCVAAGLFQDEENPMDLTIEEIIRYTDGFEREYGSGQSEKIPALIAALDQNRGLEPALRAKVIEFYRALYSIKKDGDVAYGALLKLDKKPTPANLLMAAKSYKRMIKRANRNEHTRIVHYSHIKKHGSEAHFRHAQTVHRRQDQLGQG